MSAQVSGRGGGEPDSRLDRILVRIDAIPYWAGHIVSFAILGATLAILVEIFMRYVMGSPTQWGFELPLYFAAASYLLGGAYAEIDDSHVRVDLLRSRWSPRTQAIVDLLITRPIFFFALGVLAYTSTRWAIAAFVDGARAGTRWNPVVWPIRALVPLGSWLLILQGVASTLRDIRTVRSEGRPA